MPNRSVEPSPQTLARYAGGFYLIIIVLGIWSEVFVRSSLIVPGDAAQTATNIMASEGLFRLSFTADSIMAFSDVALAVLLYILLRPVSPILALMAMVFRLIQTAIIGLNLLNHYAALLILNGKEQLAALTGEQLNALVLLSLDIHGHGYDLGLLFFGINSLLVGYLVFKANYLPRALGVLMAVAGLVYLTGSYLLFLAPALADAFSPAYLVPLVAEASFCLWLLVRGVNLSRWEERVGGVAA